MISTVEYLRGLDEDILLHEDEKLDKAIIGYLYDNDYNIIAVYDNFECINIIMKEYNLSKEEAEEHFSYCVLGNCTDKRSPVFVTCFKDLTE